jgi:putative ABC transport system substrate-binding protein
MNRRRVLVGLLACAASPVTGHAQEAERVYRVGVLFSEGGNSMAPHRDVVREELAVHGFVEGRNLRMTWRGGSGLTETDRKSARELVEARPDAILAFSAAMTHAAQFATKSIPIVFTHVSDPIADGVVSDYAHPGGNTTGVSTHHRELVGKQLELLREVLPKAKRVALVAPYATDPSLIASRQAMSDAARQLDFELIEVNHATLQLIREKQAQAMLVFTVLGERFTMDNLIDLAAKLRIASIFPDASWVKRGGLLSYGTDPLVDTRFAADQLAGVLKGAKPGDQPVVQNSRFILAINLVTAKTLGLGIPRSLLERADELLQ